MERINKVQRLVVDTLIVLRPSWSQKILGSSLIRALENKQYICFWIYYDKIANLKKFKFFKQFCLSCYCLNIFTDLTHRFQNKSTKYWNFLKFFWKFDYQFIAIRISQLKMIVLELRQWLIQNLHVLVVLNLCVSRIENSFEYRIMD